VTPRRYVAILVLAGLVIYLPFLGNKFVWDDEQFIVKNVYLTSWGFLPQIFTRNTIAGAGQASNYYRPLTTLSFRLDYWLWGLNPVGYHLTNAGLHVMAGIVLWLLLRRLGLVEKLAFWVSLLFVVHPVQTEAVVYANSRGDSLYALLLFSSLYWFTFPKPRRQVMAAAGWGLSILAKEIAVGGWGLFMLVWGLILGRKREQGWTLVMMGVVVLVYAGLRLTWLDFGSPVNPYGPLPVRLLTFSRVMVEYGRLLLWPDPLHMERQVPLIETLASPYPWLVGLVVLGMGVSRSKWRKFGLGWFLIMLLPVSGVVPINALIYEHWLYVPMVGFLVVGLTSLPALPPNWVMAGVAVVLAVLSWRQNYIWGEPIRFYEYTLKYGQSARLHNNLAMAYAEAGRLTEAVGQYRQAIQLTDVYAQTHYNLANAYVALGENQLAEQEYLAALKLDSGFKFAYINLMVLYRRTGQAEKADALIKR